MCGFCDGARDATAKRGARIHRLRISSVTTASTTRSRRSTSRPGRCRSRCRSTSLAIPKRCSARRRGTATGCCRRAGSGCGAVGRAVPDRQGRYRTEGVPDEASLEQIHSDLLIGDVETVAEKLVGEIRATHQAHMCFSFKVGFTSHKAAMRSMELMMSEVRPRVERALGALTRNAAD